MKTSAIDNINRPAAESGGMLGKPAEWWQGARTFLVEVRNELKRVSWPSRKEVYATTFVVILTSVFFGVYLWGVDLALSAIMDRVFRALGAA